MKQRKMSLGKFQMYFEILRFVIAIGIAFLISGIIIALTSGNVFEAMKNLLVGPLTTVRRFSTVLEGMIPLTFAGLAVTVMFKANQFNLATEGGFFLGALTSAIIAIYMPGASIIVLTLAMVAGGLTGAVVCMIPGALKIKWGCSEMVVSLMLNYVCLYIGTFIFKQVARDPNSAYQASYTFRTTLSQGIIKSTRLHTGIFIVAAFVVLTWLLMYKTKWGYRLRITGSNLNFARCVGVGTTGVILSAQLVGGFIGGVGGATEMLGMYTRFQWSSLPGYGFDGVIINIIARENPLYVPIAAFFISYLRIGADYMYKQSDVAAEIVTIIEGLVIMLVAANAFMAKLRHKMTTKVSKELLEEGGK